MTTFTPERAEPPEPSGPHVELLARFITGRHLGLIASVSWRGCWCRPLELTGYESCRDTAGKVLSQTIKFGGVQFTSRDPNLRIRIWL